MVIWHVSRDLGLVENQFLWQIPLALACFFGLAYSLLDDVVEWVEEKGEELREFLGCEEEESVFDKVAVAVESWLDARVTRGKIVFQLLFTVFVVKLIAALIAVLVIGLLSLYVWVGREFYQAGIFLMTMEDFFAVVVNLIVFCVKLWEESFLGLGNLFIVAGVVTLVVSLIHKLAGGVRYLFKGKNPSGILRAIAGVLLTIVIAVSLRAYFVESKHFLQLCWALWPQIKFTYACGNNILGRAGENLSLILLWIQHLLPDFLTASVVLITILSVLLLSGIIVLEQGDLLIYILLGAFYIAEGLVSIAYLLREGVVLSQNYPAYVINTGFIISGLSLGIFSLMFLLISPVKKESKKDDR